MYSLALDKEFKDENERVKGILETAFILKECPIDKDPSEIPELRVSTVTPPAMPSTSLLPRYHVEAYPEVYFLIGYIKDETQRRWIASRVPGKKERDLYNIRLARADKPVRDGSVHASTENALANAPRFLLLYGPEVGSPIRAFRIGEHWQKTEVEMAEMGYGKSNGDYLCYELDEEITFGFVDVAQLVADRRKNTPGLTDGAPIFVKGAELCAYAQ